MKVLPRRNDHVFLSRNGAPFARSSFSYDFRDLRKEAGVDADYSQIRDRALTAASNKGIAKEIYEILAGHKLPGQIDHYVARSPETVKPACDAIHAVYFE